MDGQRLAGLDCPVIYADFAFFLLRREAFLGSGAGELSKRVPPVPSRSRISRARESLCYFARRIEQNRISLPSNSSQRPVHRLLDEVPLVGRLRAQSAERPKERSVGALSCREGQPTPGARTRRVSRTRFLPAPLLDLRPTRAESVE